MISIILYYFKKFSIFGLSISSAVFHGIGQIIVSMFLFKEVGTMMVFYLPVIMLSGVITGALTASVASLVLSKFDKHVDHLSISK
jgi:heptaprenyl diphosphate synthase